MNQTTCRRTRRLTDGERDVLREQAEDAYPVGEWPPADDVDICPHHDHYADGLYHPVYRDGLCRACHEREVADAAAEHEADEAYATYQAEQRALVDSSVDYDAGMPW